MLPVQAAPPADQSWQRFWYKLNAHRRLAIALVIGLLVYWGIPREVSWALRILAAWDGGVISFLALTLVVLNHYHRGHLRLSVKTHDESRTVIFTLVVAAASASFIAITFLLRNTKALLPAIKLAHVSLGLLAVICSWLLVHTMFAIHYAHRYYRDNPTTPEQDATRGLKFPGDKEPDYWDFLYFSLVIGMTAQVSDVQITLPGMRRLALIHGVLSFFFYAFILALTINMVASIM
jgi:uncharacterized membrane protein